MNTSDEEEFSDDVSESISESASKDDLDTQVDPLLQLNQVESTSNHNIIRIGEKKVAAPALYSEYTKEEIKKDREEGLTRPVNFKYINNIKYQATKKFSEKPSRHLDLCQKVHKRSLPISRNFEEPSTGKYKIVFAKPRVKSRIALYKEYEKQRQRNSEASFSFQCYVCGKTVVSSNTKQAQDHLNRKHRITANKDEYGVRYNIS